MSALKTIMLLLLCSIAVLKFGIAWHSRVNVLSTQLASVSSESRERARVAAMLTERIGNAPESFPLETTVAVPAAVMAMLRTRIDALITINTITNTNFQSATGTMPIKESAVKTQVGLMATVLKVKGTYKDLRGLVEYFRHLQSYGVALRSIRVDRDVFDAVVEIYGS
jgi:hypothetical protein